MPLQVKRLDASSIDFNSRMDSLLAWESVSDPRVQQTVNDIIERIKQQGDTALLQLTKQLDRANFKTVANLEVSPDKLQAALDNLGAEQRDALMVAAERIRTYHEKQKQDS